jgi:hypothetical protein
MQLQHKNKFTFSPKNSTNINQDKRMIHLKPLYGCLPSVITTLKSKLINSMEQNPSWESESRSASQ